MKHIPAELLEDIVRRLVEGLHPERIILFGSHAKGASGPDSDFDLLVVTQVNGSRRQKAIEMELSLVGLDVPVDLIVVTPEDVERDRHRMGTIIQPVFEEGRVLYERAA